MQTQPLSLKDFFKTMASSFNPANIPVPTVPANNPAPTLNNIASSPNGMAWQTNQVSKPTIITPDVTPPGDQPPAPGSTGAPKPPIFHGNTPAVPVTPPAQAPTNLDYSKYTNPETGKPYTPSEYADVVAKRMSGGDIPSYAGDAITNQNMSAEELKRRGTDLNNQRNDIAVGETDPYKVASESGIQYTPAELSAIEKAYSGVYDPALKDVFAKLDARQKADEEKAQAERDLKKSEMDQKNDLEKMKVQFGYDKALKQTTAPGTGIGTGGTGEYTSDLDAIVGSTLATINTKFGQQQFQNQISRARNDADKISTVASVVLKNAPAEVRNDFSKQATAVGAIDKALSELDNKAKTGFIRNGTQYLFNTFGKDYDPQLATIASYITSAIQPYRNSITGAAWGSQEEEEYQKLFGSTKYSPEELRLRLNNLKEIMASKSAEALNVYVNPLGTYDNYFEQKNNTPAVDPDWANNFDYDNDINYAKEAIANGADKDAVKARLLIKYKQVDL